MLGRSHGPRRARVWPGRPHRPLADGTLAIVDYKTGTPPSGRMVQEGFALQLGLIGLIAQAGGFKDEDGR
jgi:RecB family exonuclease